MTSLPRRVVCAAIKTPDGTIICGPRHHHCIKQARDLGFEYNGDWVQGFVDQNNKFLTREEAMKLAKKRGQIQRYSGGEDKEILFSEDLY